MKEDETNHWDLPENTVLEIITKIDAMATSIRGDWSDPRSECREIWRLTKKLRTLLNIE